MARRLFINPFTDFGFKILFGQEGSKELLIDFLNQLLPENRQIMSLSFLNTSNLPEYKDDRGSIFDIYCISVSGERFIIEMQKAKLGNFKDRALYYSTVPITEQAKKGKWDFKIEPVYFIAIQDFVFDAESATNKDLKIDVMLKDQNGNVFYENLHLCFLQMPLFNKKEEELETHFDKWMYFLKNLGNFDHIPHVLNEPIFNKGFEIARVANLEPKERTKYNRTLKKYYNMVNAIETAKKDAKEDGIKEGRVEGRVEGEKARAIRNAKAMIEDKMSVEFIVKYSGLTKQEVEKLIKDLG